MAFDWIIVIELIGNVQRHTRRSNKIPRWLVNLNHLAGAHIELGIRIMMGHRAQPSPAVQRQLVRLSILTARRQQNFLVVTID